MTPESLRTVESGSELHKIMQDLWASAFKILDQDKSQDRVELELDGKEVILERTRDGWTTDSIKIRFFKGDKRALIDMVNIAKDQNPFVVHNMGDMVLDNKDIMNLAEFLRKSGERPEDSAPWY